MRMKNKPSPSKNIKCNLLKCKRKWKNWGKNWENGGNQSIEQRRRKLIRVNGKTM